MARPRTSPATRKAELASAAAAVFAERGVAKTAISDIVKAAGVAQGTFYLYFDSKDDIVLAVAELMTERLAEKIEIAVDTDGASAVERFHSLVGVLSGFEDDAAAVQVADFIHTKENRPLHDRVTEHLALRLSQLMTSIVEQGVREGSFCVPNATAAAWFVLGGLQSIELVNIPAAEMPAALASTSRLALRALGYQEGDE